MGKLGIRDISAIELAIKRMTKGKKYIKYDIINPLNNLI